MSGRRARELPLLLLLCLACVAAASLHGVLTYQDSRARLHALLDEFGSAIAETTATSLSASLAATDELDRALVRSMRLKATFLAGREPEGRRVLERFARAAALDQVLLFDASGQLVEVAHAVPPRGHGVVSPARLRRALEEAVRPIVEQARDGIVVRRLTAATAGIPSSLAGALPLPSGGTAVLLQDTSVFGRAQQSADTLALAERLEAETPIAFVRLGDGTKPATAPEAGAIVFSRPVIFPDGSTRPLLVGIDRTPVLEALALQLRAILLQGGLLVALMMAGAWVVFRLERRSDDLRAQVERDERLASLGRLAAGIAHEVRNPLNAIGLAAQRMGRHEDAPAQVREMAGVVESEVFRLNRTVEDVLRYARPQEPKRTAVRAGDLLDAVAVLAREESEARGVSLTVEIGAGGDTADDAASVVTLLDADLLKGALWNLVRNGVQATPPGGRVSLRVARHENRIRFEVQDQGKGPPPELVGRLFEAFSSGRADGTGLGLTLALSAAQSHGGTIEVTKSPDGGSCFGLELPYTPPDAA